MINSDFLKKRVYLPKHFQEKNATLEEEVKQSKEANEELKRTLENRVWVSDINDGKTCVIFHDM